MTLLLILLAVGLSLLITAEFLSRWDRTHGGSDEGDGSDDGGGGSWRPEPPPPTNSGGGEPFWWPEFERDFAAYVAGDDRSAVNPSPWPSRALTSAEPHSG